MIPDPDAVTVEQAPETALFPRDEGLNQILPWHSGHREFDYFAGLWELPVRRKQRYVFSAPGMISLLYALKKHGLVRGIQADFGCSPWPITNIWFEDPSSVLLPDEAKDAVTDTYWKDKYGSVFDDIRAAQRTLPEQMRAVTRLLVDCHFTVHQLAIELPDHPVTAEMELKAFNNEKDVLYDSPDSPYDPSRIGYRMAADRETIARFRKLNELSFESARRRATDSMGLARGYGQPFINGATLSCLMNYTPWKAFLKRLDEHLLPGGLLLVYNAEQGWKEHIDWMNMTKNQDTIADFVQEDLGYDLRIHELRRGGKPKNQLYLVAQKPNPHVA